MVQETESFLNPGLIVFWKGKVESDRDQHGGIYEADEITDYPMVPLPMMNHIMRFVREAEGATALEFGLVAALIAAAIIGAVTALGTSVSNTFTNL